MSNEFGRDENFQKCQSKNSFNSFQPHHVAPPNLYFNCDPAQPPPPYQDNYGIASTHNFHSPTLSHYHSYHNPMPSTGLIYDFEHNQSYYSPTTVIDSYNQLTNNNSIGIKSNDCNGFYGTNAAISHGYGAQAAPQIVHNQIKTETESNHSQQLNSSSETSDSPVESSNHSHSDHTPSHIDFNRITNQSNISRSPIASNAQSKFDSESISKGHNSSEFRFVVKTNTYL